MSTAPYLSIRMLIILSILMAFASISTDLYLPAFPSMQIALNANHGEMEWTISGFLIGFSLGQLMWGPIGDRYGRKLPILIGLILFSAGSGLCAEATSSTTIILGRIVQAVGASASVVLARAIVRDVYSGNQAARMMSVLMTIMACVPLIGPSVGGLILKFGNWQDIFWLLTAIGFLLILALKILPETLPIPSRKTSSINGALKLYLHLLKDPSVMSYASVGAFFYAAMFAYVSGSPAAYIDYFKVTPQAYGLLFGAAIIGIMLMTQVNAVLVKEYGPHKLLQVGSVGAAITGMLLAINAYHEFNGIVGLVSLLVLFTSFAGFIIANSISCAMENYPEDAGAVSALVGAMQYGFGVIGSALVGIFTDGTPVAMCLVIFLFGMCTLVSACWTRESHLKGQPY